MNNLKRIIDSYVLEKIDKLKKKIDKEGIESSLKKVYKNISDICTEQSSKLDADNRINKRKVKYNFKKAVDYAFERFNGNFNFCLLQEVAGILEPSQIKSGKRWADFRKNSARILDIDYMPPVDDVRIRKDLEKVNKFINENRLHPIEISSFLYFHITKIQPFEYANKRAAAVIMNSIHNYYGFPCISVSTKDRDKFIRLFEKAINGYRNDMQEGYEKISFDNIGKKQRELFNFFGNKMLRELNEIKDDLVNLKKYEIKIKEKDPRKTFSLKHKIFSYLNHLNEPNNTKIIKKGIINVQTNMSYEILENIIDKTDINARIYRI